MNFEVTAIIKGPGGVVEAPLQDAIIAEDMKEAMRVAIELIAWPEPPFKVIGIKITAPRG